MGVGIEKNMTEAAKWFTKAAEQGIANAQNRLGVLYYDGEGVQQDDGKAVDWFRKAAGQNLDWGQHNLGRCYEEGRGVTQDYKQAFYWYTKAAEQGNTSAQNRIGNFYYGGYGVNQDYAKAAEWYKKAAENGYSWGQYNLGDMYYQGLGVKEDTKTAIYWFQKSAEQNNASAEKILGDIYMNGYDAEQDKEQALNWYKKAAEHGNTNAMEALGAAQLPQNGEKITEQQFKDAIYWYQMAAEKGSLMAETNLGIVYYYGGGEKYISQGKYWLTKAAEKNEKYAQGCLADLYYNEEKNYELAYYWADKSANQEVPASIELLAFMYYYGHYVKKDYKKAFSLFSKAAEEGVETSKEALGMMYLMGHGCDKDYSKALSMLTANPKIKRRRSNYYLGLIYENGYGVNVDIEKARMYYAEAVKNTNKGMEESEAQKLLTKLNKKLSKAKPSIVWENLDTSVAERNYRLKAGVISNTKIQSLSVSLNGELYRGIKKVADDGYSQKIDNELYLAEGDNEITIEVTNENGKTLEKRTVTYNAPKENYTGKEERRIALVIGNAKYKDPDKRLRNPVNDANDMAKKLKKLGFDVILITDNTFEEMDKTIESLGEKAKGYDVALFYYAGHGVSHNGNNYLIPIDAEIDDPTSLKYKCTNASSVLDKMEYAHCRMKIVILDACRNNPFARKWHRGINEGGLANMVIPKGTFIAYSTSPGEVAMDGNPNDRNSPYTSALLATLDIPNLSIYDFFQNVAEKVSKQTHEKQIPWMSGTLFGRFVFNKK